MTAVTAVAPSRARRVAVIGQGYVGLPLAMAAVDAGHHVIGFEIDQRRLKMLDNGESFVEDISSASIASARAGGRYQVTDSPAALENFDIAVITVPTPLREHSPDLRYIESAVALIAPFVTHGSLVILESTTYPGTTREMVLNGLELGSGLRAGADFMIGYSPERIDPGNSVWTLRTTPKIVAGIDERSLHAVNEFYRELVDTTVPVASCEVAEMAKLLENTFRHVNIALVNELAMFANDLGIDIWEAVDAAASKPFGFMKFTPGPGVGGHCLPIDPSYLSWTVRQRLGRTFRFVELANDINDHMPDYVCDRLMRALNRRGLALSRAHILVLGLSYKKNSSDARESPAVTLIERLLSAGSTVSVSDPHVVESAPPIGSQLVPFDAAAVARADAVVVVTDHDAFDFRLLEVAPYVLDTRHRTLGANVEYL